MTIITAKIIEATQGKHSMLATLQLCYPRFIHSEFMTHCMFSKNASSSRAIPVSKMLAQVWSNPAEPIHWGKNQKGMQAREELSGWKRWLGRTLWRTAGKVACGFVYVIDKLGGHKQWANRLLEPWQYIHVIVTATEWANFFHLRDHPDAQPEMRELAKQMKTAMGTVWMSDRRQPQTEIEAWHLPYVSQDERKRYTLEVLVAISTARCARVSYLTHDGKTPSVEADLELYNRLVGSEPKHASPTEHQARVADADSFYFKLRGFKPHRWYVEKGEPFYDLKANVVTVVA